MSKADGQKELEKKAQIHSERLVTAKTFAVRKDILIFDNLPPYEWYIVEHKGAVAMVPVTENGHILLIKQWRRAIEKIIYELPAGCLDLGESKETCAQRELQEEVDHKAKELIYLGPLYSTPGYSTETLHLFVAKGLIPSSLDGDDHEAIDVEEIPLEKCLQMIDSGEICDAKTVAGLLRYERWLTQDA